MVKNKKIKKINNVKEDGDSFFEILANSIFSEHEKKIKKIKKIEISLSFNDVNNIINENSDNNTLIISFSHIIAKMNTFAFCHCNITTIGEELPEFQDGIVRKLDSYFQKNRTLLKKYEYYAHNHDLCYFFYYLYSYLIYHLLKTIKNTWKNKKIAVSRTNDGRNSSILNDGFYTTYSKKIIRNDYDKVDFNVMERILNNLLRQINIPPVTKYKPTNLL